VDLPWIRTWGIHFALGIDGISVMLVLLTTFIMPLVVLGGWTSVRTKLHAYHALMLILTTGMLGVFVARDLFLFYVMWEVMLVPMYFIVGIWGGARRLYAALKFFLFTMVGSLLMLVAILYLGIKAGDPATGIPNFAFDRVFAAAAQPVGGALNLTWLGMSIPTDTLLFLAFFGAFAVKVPMFPFHTWLPDAHVEAPTAGSVILASIMLKLGTYGFIRLAIPLFPAAAMSPGMRTGIILLAVIGVIYGSLVAMVQPDFKKLVAYSSVAHLGMVMLGLFALTRESVQGAMMVMIGHGLSTGALFLLIGMVYERRHSREIAAYGGIAKVMPIFATLLTIVALSSIGLPGTNGFVSEFLGDDRFVQDLSVPHHGVRDRRDPRRGVHAVGIAAHHLQPARQAGERATDGPQLARDRTARSRARGHSLVRPLPEAGARAHGSCDDVVRANGGSAGGPPIG
jgi:NADH-quinone oxidoreductase subunit M